MKVGIWKSAVLAILIAGCSESPVPMEIQGGGNNPGPGAGAGAAPPPPAPESTPMGGSPAPAGTPAPVAAPTGEGTPAVGVTTPGAGGEITAGTGSTVITGGTGSTVITGGTGSTVIPGGTGTTLPAASVASPPSASNEVAPGDPSVLNAPYPPKFTQEELASGGRSIKITGTLICDFCTEGQRINLDALIQESGKPILVTQLVLTRPGGFELWVPRNLQSINIGGVLDLNNDGRPASNEPMARANQEPVNLFGKTEIGGIELKMLTRQQMSTSPAKP